MGKTASKSATTAGGAPPKPPRVSVKRARKAPAPAAEDNGAAQQSAKKAKDLSELVVKPPVKKCRQTDAVLCMKRKLHREIFEKCLDKKIMRETEYWEE